MLKKTFDEKMTAAVARAVNGALENIGNDIQKYKM